MSQAPYAVRGTRFGVALGTNPQVRSLYFSWLNRVLAKSIN